MGGLRHGQGSITWKDGSKYEGAWQDNMAFGQGKFTAATGNVYEGKFAKNAANGEGKMTNPSSGAVYVGTWKDDK